MERALFLRLTGRRLHGSDAGPSVRRCCGRKCPRLEKLRLLVTNEAGEVLWRRFVAEEGLAALS
jgi:hypothetical protein